MIYNCSPKLRYPAPTLVSKLQPAATTIGESGNIWQYVSSNGCAKMMTLNFQISTHFCMFKIEKQKNKTQITFHWIQIAR